MYEVGRQRGASFVVFWNGTLNIPVATDALLEDTEFDLEVDGEILGAAAAATAADIGPPVIDAPNAAGFSPMETRGAGSEARRDTEFDLEAGGEVLFPVPLVMDPDRLGKALSNASRFGETGGVAPDIFSMQRRSFTTNSGGG